MWWWSCCVTCQQGSLFLPSAAFLDSRSALTRQETLLRKKFSCICGGRQSTQLWQASNQSSEVIFFYSGQKSGWKRWISAAQSSVWLLSNRNTAASCDRDWTLEKSPLLQVADTADESEQDSLPHAPPPPGPWGQPGSQVRGVGASQPIAALTAPKIWQLEKEKSFKHASISWNSWKKQKKNQQPCSHILPLCCTICCSTGQLSPAIVQRIENQIINSMKEIAQYWAAVILCNRNGIQAHINK